MPLILTITPAGGQARSGERQIRTLAQGTLSIGRAPGNDWVLADPDQHLSRTHCMIAFEGGRYMMTDLSTNGMLVNGAREPTSRNSRIVLTDGDSVRLGGYMLEVAEADGAAGGLQASPFGAQSFVTPTQADPFAAGGGLGAGEGPLDVDPLDDPIGHSAALGFRHPLPHAPPSLRIADPFDAAEAGQQHPASLDDDLFRARDAHDAFQGPAQHDKGDVRSHAFTPPRPITPAAVTDIDFDDLIGDLSPTPAPHPLDPPKAAPPVPPPLTNFDDLLGDLEPGAPAPIAPVAIAPVPPAPAAVAPAVAPAAAVPGGPVAAAASQTAASQTAASQTAAPQTGAPQTAAPQAAAPPSALLAAFLDGAGVPRLDMSGEDPVAAMRAIGMLFGAFVAGTRDVLMSRAEIKSELRVERTMLRARDNNALKFSVSPEEAVMALLQPRTGYTAPLAAVEEAFHDVRSHEMAVMAGLQTALIALLKRFDPAGLEARLQGGGMFEAILPGARRARFWELFCTTYNEIAREAEDDFHSVFGREFAHAYAAQLGKL